MCSRSLPRLVVLLAMLGVLVVSLVRAPAAHADDFYITVSPDRGPVGSTVTITGFNDPGLGPGQVRPVVWRCDFFGSDDRLIGNVTSDANGWWSITATVPDNCSLQKNARGESEIWVTAYGNAPTAVFTVGDACPPVLFIGAHGVNEGAPGGFADKDHWGTTIDAVWKAFQQQVPQAWPAAADYPRYDLPLPDLRNLGTLPATGQALVNLDTTTASFAANVVGRVADSWHRCGTRTKIVLAGFSQGAWVVDKALRVMQNGGGPDAGAITAIAAVGLLGDPAYPTLPEFCNGSSCRQGVATLADTILGATVPEPMGYHSRADYVNNGVDTSRFESLCLSYSDQLLDPVCGVRDPLHDFNDANIAVHTDGYIASGGVNRIADFFASQVK